MATAKTTNTAKRAAWGRPAPSSFDTLVLYRETKNMLLEYMQGCGRLGFEFPLQDKLTCEVKIKKISGQIYKFWLVFLPQLLPSMGSLAMNQSPDH